MNKIIKLAKAFDRLGFHDENYSLLKLARDTDKKYSDIAREIIFYVYENVNPKKRYTVFGHDNQAFDVPSDVLFDIFRKNNLNILEFGKNIDNLKYGLSIQVYFPMNDEDYEYNLKTSKKESLDNLPSRSWKRIAGNAYNNSINIFPSPNDIKNSDGNKNWFKIIYENQKYYTVIVHEITHLIDMARAAVTGNEINSKPTRNDSGKLNSNYWNSRLEMQARLMQVFTSLREDLIAECPSLNAEEYLKSEERKYPIFKKIITSLKEDNFIAFKDSIFSDPQYSNILRLSNIKSENVIKKYTARLFDMFNYFRRAFGLGDSSGSGSLKNIPEVEHELNKIDLEE
jgi:hypothetical protein